MYPEFSAAHELAWKVVESVLGQRDPGLVLSVDIGGSLFDIIAANAARAADCVFAGSYLLLRHRAGLGNSGEQVRVATVLTQPVIFGRAENGWLHERDTHDPLESYGRFGEKIVTQTIDSWSMRRRPLRLVHFGDPQLVADQLCGAREAIARDRPVLTLYTARQQRTELLALLEAFGYFAFNLSGRHVNASEPYPDPANDFGWIALPQEWQHEMIEAATEQARRTSGPAPSSWEQESARTALPRQRRSPALFGISQWGSRPLTLERIIPAAEMLCLNDCYRLETAGHHSWRWLGPRQRTRIAVPCPLPGAYRIALHITDCKLENGLADCRVLADGREVRAATSASLPGELSFAANIEPESYVGYIEIDVVTMGNPIPVSGDTRTLRLCLQSIAVSPWLR